jgi:hypothetical protein
LVFSTDEGGEGAIEVGENEDDEAEAAVVDTMFSSLREEPSERGESRDSETSEAGSCVGRSSGEVGEGDAR